MRSAARLLLVVTPLFVLAAAGAGSDESVDLGMLTRIREEGFSNSKVMDTASYLCDVIGARVTGSPAYERAHEWTRKELETMGLQNAHLESWDFARGWWMESVSVQMVRPDRVPLLALPRAWTPGTNGPVVGKVTRVKVESEQDLEKLKGKLSGVIVMLDEPANLTVHESADADRYTQEELEQIVQYQASPRRRGGPPAGDREAFLRREALSRAVDKFLADEKVLARLVPAGGDGGTLKQVQGSHRNPVRFPVVLMAPEHYNRIARIMDKSLDVELELNIKVSFSEKERKGLNTIAEIPGSDLKDQVVMLGGHLDSWHGGTGATDDAAGVAVAMEAVRILKALDVKPRRTIRVALWGGEEVGLLGSRAYVKEHFGTRPERPEGERTEAGGRRPETGPLELKSDHAGLSAYYNLDNGTGKIRGIYVQGNAALVPIFSAWIEPIKDLGVTAVTMRRTSGTDHLSFDSVGLPGFQFVQDPVEYFSRTWHTNMDVYDRLQREDLMQASVVMAWFVYNTAMRDEMLPRKPLPPSTPGNRPPSD